MDHEDSPREARKRQAIREGARAAFLELGFAGATTADIASRAGVSKQTLYTYYADKHALLVDVMRWLMSDRSSEKALAEVEPTSRAELEAVLLDEALGFLRGMMDPDYLALMRVVAAESSRVPELGPMFAESVPMRAFRRVERRLKAARRRGLLTEHSPDTAVRMFIGPLLTFAVLDGLLAGQAPRPPNRARVKKIVEAFLCAVSPS